MVDIPRKGFEIPISYGAKPPSRRSYISSVAVLDNGSVVLADFSNECVRYISAGYEFKDEMDLPSFPWCVCGITETEFAVSVPSAGKVMFINAIEDELHFVREFETEMLTTDCRAVCYMDGLMFLNFGSVPNACVKVVTLDGAILNVIHSDVDGNKLFTTPNYMAVKRMYNEYNSISSPHIWVENSGCKGEESMPQNRSPDNQSVITSPQELLPAATNETPTHNPTEEGGHIIYVSDELKRQIIVLDSAGRVLVIHNMHDRTFGVCFDGAGDLLFNMGLLREVYRLRDGDHTCIMSRNNLELFPEAIAYNGKRNEIIITFHDIVRAYNTN